MSILIGRRLDFADEVVVAEGFLDTSGDQWTPGGLPVVFADMLRGAQRCGLRGSLTWTQGLVSWRRR